LHRFSIQRAGGKTASVLREEFSIFLSEGPALSSSPNMDKSRSVAPLVRTGLAPEHAQNFAVSSFCAVFHRPERCLQLPAGWPVLRRFQPPEHPYFAGKSPFARLRPMTALFSPGLLGGIGNNRLVEICIFGIQHSQIVLPMIHMDFVPCIGQKLDDIIFLFIMKF
jgi:hypothetical protein